MNFQKELCGFADSLRENGMFGWRRRGLSFQHQKDDGRWVGVARRERKSCAKIKADWKKDFGYLRQQEGSRFIDCMTRLVL